VILRNTFRPGHDKYICSKMVRNLIPQLEFYNLNSTTRIFCSLVLTKLTLSVEKVSLLMFLILSVN
jgi:hypothetical protein